ncbi:MAG: DNA repair protein RecO [Deltaproteobacteria bacterium]|nr:DNA repair protein RecO [Deltaproteobacteria bacterium]
MGLVKDQAIVLKKLSYGESDRIVHLFTRTFGKISGIAKGGNKSIRRFMNTLEPLRIIEIEYFDNRMKGLSKIQNAYVLEDFQGIEKDFRKFSVATFFMEVADRLTKEKEPNPRLFQILCSTYRELKNTEVTFQKILRLLLDSLEVLGFLPNFKTCVHCNREVSNGNKRFFSNQKGGILCETCARTNLHKTYSPELLTFFSHLEISELKDEGYLALAFEIIENFIRYHLDVEFKSFKFIKPVP